MKAAGRLIICFGLLASAGSAAGDDVLELMCEGREVRQTEPVNRLRFNILVERRELKNRFMSFDRFEGSFDTAEPHFIFEPVAYLGELHITYCNKPGWPEDCRRQRPAQRDLMVSQMSPPGGELFLAGYVGCSFCPLAPIEIVETGAQISFQYFESGLVAGSCTRE